MRIVILGLFVLAACGEKKAKDEPKAADDPGPVLHSHPGGGKQARAARTGEPRPQPKVTATVDGKPVEMKGAFAWLDPGGSLQLLVTSVPATCEWATGKMRMLEDGEEDFSAILGKMLQPDGSFAWQMRQVSYGANTRAGGVGPATVVGEVTPGQPVAITLGFEQKSVAFGDEVAKTIKVDGTIDALGCGEPAPDDVGVVPPPPAQAGTMTVAGQKLPIAGAVIEQKPSGERTIVLSSGAATCSGFAHEENSAVAVTLHYKADVPDAWQVDLTGDWFDGQKAEQRFEEGRVTATSPAIAAGATTVELALSGATKIFDYPVAIEGAVTAQVCPAS
jgi:hypothetical protein